jgi:uncharacterized GH25 family protein
VKLEVYEGTPFGGAARSVLPSGARRYQRLWRQGRTDLAMPGAGFVADHAGVQLVVYDAPAGDRFAKALIVVGEPAAGDPLRWSEVGQTLEIVPQSDPIVLAREGGVLELQVLFEREPLVGARIEAIWEGEPAILHRARTDEIGIANLGLDRPGRWLVRAEHEGECDSCADRRTRTFGATLSLAVAVSGE